MKKMTVKGFVFEGLKLMGADGLCTTECGCDIDDLAPCDGEGIIQCVPATKHIATAEDVEKFSGITDIQEGDVIYIPWQDEAKP
jgi:hypothetical protein